MKIIQWTAVAILALGAGGAQGSATLDIYHVNDIESRLLGTMIEGEPYGGAARLVAVANALRSISTDRGRDSLLLSSGDNILPGLTREASARDGTDYDAITLSRLNFDAIALGNHDFDAGPDALADFLGFDDPNDVADAGRLLADVPFLSANLDFSGNARLQALVDAGQIAKSVVIVRGAHRYGVIGGQTDHLADITQLGEVAVNDFAAAVKAEADALTSSGIDKIILVSHLQGLNNDVAFIAQNDLGNIDVIIAGGGDELLVGGTKLSRDADGALVDVYGDEAFDATRDTYPLPVNDNAGNTIYVVTTSGEAKYLGSLAVEFDDAGKVVGIGGDPIAIGPDFGEDAEMLARVTNPVTATVDEIAGEVVGSTEVPLDSRRPNKRIEEVNLGNLFADAMRWQATEELGDTLAGKIVVAVQNSGGIRNASLILPDATPSDPGTITRAETLSIAPFSNFLTIADDLTENGAAFDAETILGVMEHAVSNVENVDGRFMQISGFKIVFDPSRAAGERLTELALEDGTVIWTAADGFVSGAENLDFVLVTNSFIANGGDGYSAGSATSAFADLASITFADLPFTYEDPLVNFIREALDGVVDEAAYGGPEGRIR